MGYPVSTMGAAIAGLTGKQEHPMGSEPYDWADDEAISPEETMRRFEALGPTPTTGPMSEGQREHIPTPDELIPPPARTYASSTTTKVIQPAVIAVGSTAGLTV
jgi:hypothetical protein